MVSRVTLTLMRHLPTIGNQQRQYIGWTDESIVDIGIVNCEMPWKPENVYGSDLRRCQESAALYFPKAVYKQDSRFRETYFGEWEGKNYALLKENQIYRSWINDPSTYAPPGGESLREVEKRVLSGLAELPEDESDYFIVTHGGPIRILLTRFSPQENDFWSWHIPHGSAWRLEWHSKEDWKEGRRCASLSAVPITGNGIT